MGEDKVWKKLVFKQVQPIHIGKGAYGVINETRVFIPGWTMWGALTKAYGLQKGWAEQDWEKEENQKLFANISCFFPSFDEEGKTVLFPEFKDGKLYYGDYTEEEFRAAFVETRASTAIDPMPNAALEESLHEVDVILPGAKKDILDDKDAKQLYWVGVINVAKNIELPKIIFVGGDVRYGLGMLELVDQNDKQNENQETNINEWKFKKNSENGIFTIRGYLSVNTADIELVMGKTELLVEIEKSWEKAQLRVKRRGVFYVPGSKVIKDQFELSLGILKKKTS